MNELLLQMGLSNALLSLGLALLAVIVDKTTRRPYLAHILWLLVLVKLVTPPVVTIPIFTIPELDYRTVVSVTDHSQATSTISKTEGNVHHSTETWSTVWDHGKKKLSLLWLLGSFAVLAVSLLRVYRFNGLLRESSEVAPQEYQTVAAQIANRLSLKTVPTIYTISAHLSPMVWWIGGNVRVVIPVALLDQMSARHFQLILAHELAHVRRRDYLVRWIEWLACICFWWNPVVWWARYNLRANEELCCDALVISSLKLKPQIYADSVLKAIECLAFPVIRPPVMASEMKSGGFLKRRFKMILSKTLNRSTSRYLQACVLLLAVAILPLGVVFARNSNDKTEAYLEQVRAKLQAEVEAGNLIAEDAFTMMIALRKKYDAISEYRTTTIEANTQPYLRAVGQKQDAPAVHKRIYSGSPPLYFLTAWITKRTYVKIYIDDQKPKEYIFEPGSKPRWKAKEGFDIIVGNAGGVEFDLNGKIIGNLGEIGEVVRLKLPVGYKGRDIED
jgi:beta-lactamase regulating signal transducer with metallopeptidase domain